MSKQKEVQEPARDSRDRRRVCDFIASSVLLSLGEPGDLKQVQVRELWEGHYRVNVLAGVDAASIRVVDSFFLRTDDGGNIVDSTPLITRRY